MSCVSCVNFRSVLLGTDSLTVFLGTDSLTVLTVCLTVLDQRIEARVFGIDLEDGGRGLGCQAPDVEGNVEIEGIRPVAGNLDVLRSRDKLLKRCRDFKRQLALADADEDQYPEMLSVEASQRTWLLQE